MVPLFCPAWSPRRSPSPCPARPAIANRPRAEIGQRPAVLDYEHSCPVWTDGEIFGLCARARNHRRIRRHGVNVSAVVCEGRRRGSNCQAQTNQRRTAPVQSVWACVETVDAAKSATVASNLICGKRCVRSRTSSPRAGARISAFSSSARHPWQPAVQHPRAQCCLPLRQDQATLSLCKSAETKAQTFPCERWLRGNGRSVAAERQCGVRAARQSERDGYGRRTAFPRFATSGMRPRATTAWVTNRH